MIRSARSKTFVCVYVTDNPISCKTSTVALKWNTELVPTELHSVSVSMSQKYLIRHRILYPHLWGVTRAPHAEQHQHRTKIVSERVSNLHLYLYLGKMALDQQILSQNQHAKKYRRCFLYFGVGRGIGVYFEWGVFWGSEGLVFHTGHRKSQF